MAEPIGFVTIMSPPGDVQPKRMFALINKGEE